MQPRLVAAFFVRLLWRKCSARRTSWRPVCSWLPAAIWAIRISLERLFYWCITTTKTGAMGLIVNRRTDVPLSRIFEDLKEAKGRADPIYVGGPVETGTVLALLKSASKPKDAERVFGDVYLISSKVLLEKTLADGSRGRASSTPIWATPVGVASNWSTKWSWAPGMSWPPTLPTCFTRIPIRFGRG